MCPKRDSNPHAFRQRFLRPSCIPFHHQGLCGSNRITLFSAILLLPSVRPQSYRGDTGIRTPNDCLQSNRDTLSPYPLVNLLKAEGGRVELPRQLRSTVFKTGSVANRIAPPCFARKIQDSNLWAELTTTD